MFLRMFGLSHHKHSGKKLAHAHTSYFGLAVVTLFAGIVPALVIQSRVSADPPALSDTITVSANIDTEAPVITAPADNQRFTASHITISGTCQTDLVVGVFKNDIVAGSTTCLENGTFSLPIDLLFGKNDLYARHFRPGAVSPASNHVIVYFDYLVTATSPNTQDNSQPTSANEETLEKQLIIISEESAKSQPYGKSMVWKIRIVGGLAPYALNWDWGDGTTELISLNQAGEYIGKHTYSNAGDYKIKIKVADSKAQAAALELTAISTGLNFISQLERNLTRENDSRLLWLSLISLFFICISFWLGEHYQAWRTNPRRQAIKRHA